MYSHLYSEFGLSFLQLNLISRRFVSEREICDLYCVAVTLVQYRSQFVGCRQLAILTYIALVQLDFWEIKAIGVAVGVMEPPRASAPNGQNLGDNDNSPVLPINTTLTVIMPPPMLTPSEIYIRDRADMVAQYMHITDNDIPPPKADFSAPPPYDVAANSKLPTYEEVQREKHLLGENSPRMTAQPPPPIGTFLTIDSVENQPDYEADNSLLGTDFMFFTAFFFAFIFNWIGFLLLMCFCHTIASRYGALSGFGLSLAKWTLIVKHSTELASHDNSWLCWLIMAFGVLICVRAIIQYLNIKRGWRLLSGTAQERLLFFH
ncbi:nedd4 family interacting protein [Arctopsyche grandis]|uniref:nedd4 family interacting protein n=1 Tax=Arctopsyche grandis TaxID=121162 RepID=UPI00406D819D